MSVRDLLLSNDRSIFFMGYRALTQMFLYYQGEVIPMFRDTIAEWKGRVTAHAYRLDGLFGALQMLESIYFAASPEAREKARNNPMWETGKQRVEKALKWG